MIIAIGRIENKNSLIGIRIYDTNNKSIKDIKIEDSDKIDIKNRSKIYRLGVIDNKKESKPLVLLGYKDRKYKVLNINGEIKILEDISKYEVINIKSNIEEYKEHINRLRMLGKESCFKYEIKEWKDEVIITRYIENEEKTKTVEIPSFVTGFDTYGVFKGVEQSLKIIHRYNQIKDVSFLFFGYRGDKLELSNFDTSKVEYMYWMFHGCKNLKGLDIRNFDTSNVKDMSGMFNECINLKELDLRNFDTRNVTDMNNMFDGCVNLKELNIRNFDTGKVENMRFMFCGCRSLKELYLRNFDTRNVIGMNSMFALCENLKELELRNFDTSKVTDMSYMFSMCKILKELDLSNFDTSKVTNTEKMFYGTSLTKENTGLK